MVTVIITRYTFYKELYAHLSPGKQLKMKMSGKVSFSSKVVAEGIPHPVAPRNPHDQALLRFPKPFIQPSTLSTNAH